MTLNNITAILPSPNKKGYFDIYADGELILTITEDAVVEAGIKTGMPLDDEKLLDIERRVVLTRAKHKAYTYLSYGDMSEKKLFEKLTRAGFEKDIVKDCIESVKSQGFIDNSRYASTLARNMAQVKLYGIRRIENELKMRGISGEDIENAISELEIDFDKNIRKLIGTRFKFDATDKKSVASAVRSLMRYGYDYENIKSALYEAVSEDDYE